MSKSQWGRFILRARVRQYCNRFRFNPVVNGASLSEIIFLELTGLSSTMDARSNVSAYSSPIIDHDFFALLPRP